MNLPKILIDENEISYFIMLKCKSFVWMVEKNLTLEEEPTTTL